VDAKSQAELDAEAEAKWGFLKNIINIHTFFDNSAKNQGARAQQGEMAQLTFAQR